MIYKKMFIRSIIFFLILLPSITQARLITTNNTDEYSTTYVESSGICAGASKNGYTPPRNEVLVRGFQVRAMCGNKTPCVATLVMSKTLDDVKQCIGKKIGTAQINDLKSDIVTDVHITDSCYQLSGIGTNHTVLSSTCNKRCTSDK